MSVCFRITRLMNNQKKSRKKLLPKKKRKRRQECCGHCEKCITLGLCITRFMHSFLKVESLGETRCRKSWNRIQRVRLSKSTLRHASIREKKGPSLGKINVKVPHQRSLHAMKFEDRSRGETERQQRCAWSKAWNLAKNIYKLKEKDQAALYFPAEEWVVPAASTKELEERWFVVDSGGECAYGQ